MMPTLWQNRQSAMLSATMLAALLLAALLSLTPVSAQTSTPAPTPTAIPTVTLQLSGIITTTQTLLDDQVQAWSLDAPTAPFFLGIAAIVFVFGLILFIKRSFTPWRDD